MKKAKKAKKKKRAAVVARPRPKKRAAPKRGAPKRTAAKRAAPKRVQKKKEKRRKLAVASLKRRQTKRKVAKLTAQERKKKRSKVISKLLRMRKKKGAVKKARKARVAKRRVVRAPKKAKERKKAAQKKRVAARRVAPPVVKPPRPKRRPLPYSKEQIEQLRKELLDERARLLEELGELDEIAQNSKGEGRTETPGYSIHPAEYATDTQTIDTALGLRSLAQRHLDEVEQALEQLNAGDYGYCESCGKPIEFDRLMAKPSARLCISCRKSFEAGRMG
jgi:RNA polymerase-binding protein DksA